VIGFYHQGQATQFMPIKRLVWEGRCGDDANVEALNPNSKTFYDDEVTSNSRSEDE
jgi:hypothetical protein